MALPKLGIPYYSTKLISGKEIKFRPFLVKEEKALLMASESKDSKLIINTIKNTIMNCISPDTPINFDSVPLFELEWLILNIRMKSVGEASNFKLKCSECEEMNACSLDLNTITIDNKENAQEVRIMLTPTVGVTLQQTPYRILEKIDILDIEKVDERKLYIENILECVVNVFDENQVYTKKDFSNKELMDFMDNLTQSQFMELGKHLENPPKLSYTINKKCEKCGHENTRKLTGISDFF